MIKTRALGLALVGWAAVGATAHAQEIEVPILVLEQAETDVGESDDEIDLGNVVQSAAKTVTTIQEAPAIVTVITEDDIRSRGFRDLPEMTESVPGFLKVGAFHNQFPYIMVRGHVQGVLLLSDGLSLFEDSYNVSAVNRVIPLEKIKRVEIVSGPGGVLWGANSYLGILNIITKTADDLDGWEVGVEGGHGDGDQEALRGYVMVGEPELFGTDAKLFAHASFETYRGGKFSMPYFMYHSPQPQPNSLFIYGPESTNSADRSMIFNLDGTLQMGKFTLRWQYPISTEYRPMGISGAVLMDELPEDAQPECAPKDVIVNPDGSSNRGELGDPTDNCVDIARVARKSGIGWIDRFVVLEWRDRFAQSRAGVQVKAYGFHGMREMKPIVVFPPVQTLIEGGVGFHNDNSNYRAGLNLDADFEFSDSVRLLYGGEVSYSTLPDNTTGRVEGSVQGGGSQSTFDGPYNYDRLPFACPHNATWDPGTMQPTNVILREGCPVTFAFESSRTQLGAFTSLQIRPMRGLILDGGIRLMQAPDSMSLDGQYGRQITAAGAIVYEFAKDWHVKLNYTEGFRAPTFNSLNANGEAVQVGGRRGLENESSRSIQTEINARLLKGVRRIRELDFRADYSYTILENFISFPQGQYVNAEDRGIHSAEFLGKLYLRGDHRVELAYTWLRINTGDLGMYRTTPEHWFQLTSINSLVTNELESVVGFKVYGAWEDPNRRTDVRHLKPFTAEGDMPNYVIDIDDPDERQFVNSYELVVDRVPPSAELRLGLRWSATESLLLSADLHNTFNARRYQPEIFHGLSPRLDLLPFPYDSFSFVIGASYRM